MTIEVTYLSPHIYIYIYIRCYKRRADTSIGSFSVFRKNVNFADPSNSRRFALTAAALCRSFIFYLFLFFSPFSRIANTVRALLENGENDNSRFTGVLLPRCVGLFFLYIIQRAFARTVGSSITRIRRERGEKKNN